MKDKRPAALWECMKDGTLVDRVRGDARVELDRLGSDKALLAATDADLATDRVLRTVAARLTALSTAIDEWAGEADGEAAETFRRIGEDVDRHAGRLREELDDGAVSAETDLQGRLTALDGDVEAAGGVVGQSLVLDRTLLQVINFFINEADDRRADLARDVRESANSWAEDAGSFLENVGADEKRKRAAGTAVNVIEAAYADYVETLEDMGIDPKPVC